jgi:hypothetical protein
MGVRRNAFSDAGIAEDPKSHGDDVYSEWFLELPVKNRNFHRECPEWTNEGRARHEVPGYQAGSKRILQDLAGS